jgi:hypothetical protein
MLIDACISHQNALFAFGKSAILLSRTKLPNALIHQFLAVVHKKRIMLSYLVGKYQKRGWDNRNVSTSKIEKIKIRRLEFKQTKRVCDDNCHLCRRRRLQYSRRVSVDRSSGDQQRFRRACQATTQRRLET